MTCRLTVMTTKAPTARERARAEITAEILTVARRHLADRKSVV